MSFTKEEKELLIECLLIASKEITNYIVTCPDKEYFVEELKELAHKQNMITCLASKVAYVCETTDECKVTLDS